MSDDYWSGEQAVADLLEAVALAQLFHEKAVWERKEACLEVARLKACIRLILETDALKHFAYERGDDDASIYELCCSLIKRE